MSDTATTPPAPPPSTPPPATSWIDSLPEDLRKEPSIASIKAENLNEAFSTIAKNYVETKKFVGVDKIAKPSDKWGEKEWGDFYGQLGRPESPDKYSNPDLGEGVKLDENQLKGGKELFHKLGLSDKQAKELIKFDVERMTNASKTLEEQKIAAVAQAEAALKKEWGQKFDMNVELAKAAASKFGDESLQNFLKANPQLDNNPDFMKFLAKVGEGMMEDSAKGRGATVQLTDATVAQREIMRLKGEPQNSAFWSAWNNGDKHAVTTWNDLHRRAYPEAK
jgi:hypothetical protein